MRKGRTRLRWVLPVLSVMLLLCVSTASAQAHEMREPGRSAVPISAFVTITSQGVDEGRAAARGDHACPCGSNHINHMACGGIACHAVASGGGPAMDFPPGHTAYERVVATVGAGRVVAPLFHPPKI